ASPQVVMNRPLTEFSSCRMHAEDLWAGLRSGLLDEAAGLRLLDHILMLAEDPHPGTLQRSHTCLREGKLTLAALQQRARDGYLSSADLRRALDLQLTLLEAARPGCLRLIQLELVFAPDRGAPEPARLVGFRVLRTLG